MSQLGVLECPRCGGPVKDGKCEYCGPLVSKAYFPIADKCRNCAADLEQLVEKEGWMCCRYCRWPIEKIAVVVANLSTVTTLGFGLTFMGIFATVILGVLGAFNLSGAGAFLTILVLMIVTGIGMIGSDYFFDKRMEILRTVRQIWWGQDETKTN